MRRTPMARGRVKQRATTQTATMQATVKQAAITRRGFLTASTRCAAGGVFAGMAGLTGGGAAAGMVGMAGGLAGSAGDLAGMNVPWAARGRRRVVAQTPFARVEELGSGMFAIVSTPMGGDYTTVCNGGIIAGSSRTLIVESFATPAGARWAAETARELTGRAPDEVVVTHYHGDHSMGITGYEDSTLLRATAATRDLVVNGPNTDEATRERWRRAELIPEREPVEVDLGDRTATLTPRGGHTDSDVTVEVEGGEEAAWCGDLVWNAMFPNYMDATPSRLSRTVRALAALPAATLVTGHGPLADAAAMQRYIALLDSVEETGREAWRIGISADEAAESYRVPGELGEWVMFNPNFAQRAIQAWLDELAA